MESTSARVIDYEPEVELAAMKTYPVWEMERMYACGCGSPEQLSPERATKRTREAMQTGFYDENYSEDTFIGSLAIYPPVLNKGDTFEPENGLKGEHGVVIYL